MLETLSATRWVDSFQTHLAMTVTCKVGPRNLSIYAYPPMLETL